MFPRVDIRPEALAKILLIQSVASSLPDKTRMMEFVCRGLEEVPGVGEAGFEDEIDFPAPEGRISEEKKGGSYLVSLRASEQHHGHIVLTVADEERFEPYHPYVHNLGLTLAVFLEERRQRQIIDGQRRTLERRVDERTKMWIREVREREAAQREAQRIQQRVEKLESLGILAGGIAHDFNNLLGGIFGFIDLALDSCTQNPVATMYLERSLSVCNRAEELTRQLLTFAKGDAPRTRVCSIQSLLERSSSLALAGSSLECELCLPEELWSCEIDESQMSRVIENIIINAAQAMLGGGRITIAAENVAGEALLHLPAEHERYVKISITDSGPGIPKKLLARIFDPFFTTKDDGHGLGLAICHSIVEKHGGVLSAESEPGLGTSIHIHLPALDEPFSPKRKKTRTTGKNRCSKKFQTSSSSFSPSSLSPRRSPGCCPGARTSAPRRP